MSKRITVAVTAGVVMGLAPAVVGMAMSAGGHGGTAGDAGRPGVTGGPTGSAARRAPASSPDPGHPGQPSAAPAMPLAGKIVGIDPGHNGLNGSDPAHINSLIWNGRQWEACDTTGTQTDAGYTEARFTWRVARFLRADLVRDGAKVVMTRPNNNGVGPCVNRRAQLINRAHAMVSVDIHGDGGPSSGRGFSILLPVADGPNDTVIAPSLRLGRDIRAALLAGTAMPVSDYYGQNGFAYRDDLAGLNLATEPKVLVECGNMRNAQDAALMTSTRFQQQLARAFETAIIRFLAKR